MTYMRAASKIVGLSLMALAFGLVTSPLSAQQAGSAYGAGPVVSSPAPSSVGTVAPSHLAVARAVVMGSGMARSFDTMVPDAMAQLKMTMMRTRPELNEDVDAVLVQLQPEFTKWSDDMVNQAARIVAGLMSEEELKQIAAFYASPVGKKYVESQSIMLSQLMGAMQTWNQQVSENMMTRVRAEMKKRGKEI